MINLSEIFLSLQGETSFSGYPCIFVRLAGCNLNCTYCDTKYAMKSESCLNIDQIMSKLEEFMPCKLCSITGGEPLLQKEVYLLINELQNNKFQILLETNGSLDLGEVQDFVYKIVDVKCPGSGNENSFLVSNFRYISKTRDELKFVLSDRSDYDWALEFIGLHKLEYHKILFSPVVTLLDPAQLATWILNDLPNARMQLQMHKQLWSDKDRGV